MTAPVGIDALRTVLPPPVRQGIYAAYALVGIVLGAALVAVGEGSWLDVAMRVYVWLGAPVGALALAHTTPVQAEGPASAPVAGPESDLPVGTPVDVEPRRDATPEA